MPSADLLFQIGNNNNAQKDQQHTVHQRLFAHANCRSTIVQLQLYNGFVLQRCLLRSYKVSAMQKQMTFVMNGVAGFGALANAIDSREMCILRTFPQHSLSLGQCIIKQCDVDIVASDSRESALALHIYTRRKMGDEKNFHSTPNASFTWNKTDQLITVSASTAKCTV